MLERAVCAEVDPNLSRWKLEHITRLGNDYVHAGGFEDDFHHICEFLRQMLACHINHCVFRGADLADPAALLAYVKLPADRAPLLQMRDLIDRRFELIDGAPEP